MCQKCVCEGPRPDIFLRKMRRWPTGAREDAPHRSSPGRRKTTARQPLAPGNTAFVTRAGMTSRGGGTRSPHPLLLGPEQGTAAADDATEAPPRVKHAAAAWPGNPVSGYSPGEEESAYPKRCLRSHVHRGLVSSRGDVEADNRQTDCDARTEISRL